MTEAVFAGALAVLHSADAGLWTATVHICKTLAQRLNRCVLLFLSIEDWIPAGDLNCSFGLLTTSLYCRTENQGAGRLGSLSDFGRHYGDRILWSTEAGCSLTERTIRPPLSRDYRIQAVHPFGAYEDLRTRRR